MINRIARASIVSAQVYHLTCLFDGNVMAEHNGDGGGRRGVFLLLVTPM